MRRKRKRGREIEESIRNNSVTQAWKMFPSQIVDHFSQITVDSHRYSAYFERKAGRRRFERSGEEREREEGSFTSHSAKIIWQSVPKAGVARAGAPSDSTAGMRGSFRARRCRWRISGRGVGSRRRIQPCATPVRFRNIAANLAPQNELLKPGRPSLPPILGDHCHVVSLPRGNVLIVSLPSQLLSLSLSLAFKQFHPRRRENNARRERCVCAAWAHVWVSAACFKNLISRLWCWISGIPFFFLSFFSFFFFYPGSAQGIELLNSSIFTFRRGYNPILYLWIVHEGCNFIDTSFFFFIFPSRSRVSLHIWLLIIEKMRERVFL